MTKEIAVKTMTKADARAFVESIKNRLGDIRKMLIELHDRMGWTALGYDSWDQLVKEEFTWWSKRYVNMQLSAGKIEQKLLADTTGGCKGNNLSENSPIGFSKLVCVIPESHLRPLAGLPEDQQLAAYTDAKEEAEAAGETLTAKMVKAKVDLYKADNEPYVEPTDEEKSEEEDAPEPTVEELMAESNKALESLAREITAMHKQAGELDTPHVDEERLGILQSQLKTASGTLRAAKGYAVCSYCDGTGCKVCLHSGWLTKTQAESAPEKA